MISTDGTFQRSWNSTRTIASITSGDVASFITHRVESDIGVGGGADGATQSRGCYVHSTSLVVWEESR